MKLSDYVMDRIAAEGVEHVFMLPGGGCMHLVDSLGRHPRLDFVCNLHEQGTAVAVDAYAQVRGFGAGLVTTGPGGTNAVTGVAAAWLDSTPCLFVSGQVKRPDLRSRHGNIRQFGFQELDIVSIVRSITKYAVTVEDPAKIRHHLDRALHEARHGRPGPVWIDIPLDVQAAEIEPERLPAFLPPPEPEIDLSEAASRTLALLEGAHRPAILVGNGARRSLDAFLALAERLQVPVLTTWKAADFLSEDHPLFAGRPGAAGQRAANLAQQAADVLLVLGARLDLGQVAYMHDQFAPRARKVVVDIDGAELGKLAMDLDQAVEADAGAFVRALSIALGGRRLAPKEAWIARIRDWKARHPVLHPDYWGETGWVNLYALVEALSACLGEGDLLVPCSSGQGSEVTHQAWRVAPGLRMLNSQGLGPMGFGPPAALGACVAAGGRRTVCLDGDGGFQMNLQELETIRRLGLPVKIFVLDNRGYGSIRGSQRAYFQGRLVASDAASGLTLPDSLRVAEAYGIPTARLESHEGLRERVAALLAEPGPLVCVVKLNPDQPTLPRVTSYQKPDGSMGTRPMEHMFPDLDHDPYAQSSGLP